MKSRARWLRSVRLRVLLPFAVANLLGAGAVVIWLVHHSEQTLLRELENRARSVADVASAGTASVDELEELQGFLSGLTANREVKLVVIALGDPLQVVAATRPEWVGRAVDDVDDPDVRTDLRVGASLSEPLSHLHRDAGAFDYSVRTTVSTRTGERHGELEGAVLVHLDATPIWTRVAEQGRRLIALVVGIGALVCGVSYLTLQRVVLRPIRAIDAAMQRRAAGDADARAPGLGSSELGVLAQTLNGMLDALAREETRYRSLVANMPGAVFRCRLEPHLPFELLSPQIEALTGYDVAHWMLPGNSLGASVHAEDQPALEAAIRNAVQTCEPFEIEVRVLHASGELRWALVRGHVPTDERGRPSAFEGLILDMTARRRAEVELRHSQERLRSILDTTGDAIVVADSTGRIVQVNRATTRIFGWAQEDLVGHDVSMLMPEPWRSEHAGYLRRFHETGERKILGQRRELVGVHRDGSEFPIELGVGEIVLSGGERLFTGTVRDITDRRDAEAERLRHLQEVEETRDRIEQQAAELARVAEELAGARDAAERGSRAKSEFLATMSHEIRTPMNGVIGMTRLLLETPLDVEQREYAESVQRSAEALLTVINDILDFSKIEAGRLVIEPLPFDLRATLDDLVQLFAPRADEKGLELVLRTSPSVPALVTGDAGRIRQILVNLVGNALKFTASGHVLLDVDASPVAGGVNLSIRVEDTGIGIPAEKHAEIFEKFVQADASTTRKYGGTGLGLSITRRLVELMGGALSLTSEPGRGTVFTVELTLAVPEGTDGPGLPRLARPVRMLVVDDHEVARRALVERLHSIGAVCEAVSTIADARELLAAAVAAKVGFDVVLVDAVLRGETGAELAATVREEPRLRAIPLVLMSAAGVRGDAAQLRELGFAACLAKPPRLPQLLDTLDALGLGADPDSTVTRARTAKSAPISAGLSALLALDRTPRVLVAEDNPVNQKLARKLLERLGCEVTIAENGRVALELVREQDFDVVFMDVQMPEMDGLDATRAIRRLTSESAAIPIVAMTANAMEGDRERCLEAGMDDYVSKPIDPRRLTETLGRWVGSGKSGTSRAGA